MTINYSTIKTINTIVEKSAKKYIEEGIRLKWEVTCLPQTEYLTEFRNIVKNNGIGKEIPLWRGKPDSFLLASCLVYALIKHKKLCFCINDSTPKEILLLNYKFAVEVALKFIESSNVKSFISDELGNFNIKKEHKTVEMKIPEGILPENISTLLYKSLAHNDYYNCKMNIIEFSIILHLIYCINCK